MWEVRKEVAPFPLKGNNYFPYSLFLKMGDGEAVWPLGEKVKSVPNI